MSSTDKPEPHQSEKKTPGDDAAETGAQTGATQAGQNSLDALASAEPDTSIMGDGPLADDARVDAPAPEDPAILDAVSDRIAADSIPADADADDPVTDNQAPDDSDFNEILSEDPARGDLSPVDFPPDDLTADDPSLDRPFADDSLAGETEFPAGEIPPESGAPELEAGGEPLAEAARHEDFEDDRALQARLAERMYAARAEPAPSPARGGALALVLGGIVAAGIGAAATYFLIPYWGSTAVTENAEVAELRTVTEELGYQLSETGTAIGGLLGRIEALEAGGGASEEAVSTAEIDALRSEIETLRSELSQGLGDGAEARAQIEAAAAEAAAQIAAAEQQAAALRADAEAAAEQVRGRAAVTQLRAALLGGMPLEPALAALEPAGIEAPAALGGPIPTLAELQDTFVPAAREALGEARRVTAAQEGAFGRIGAFLMAETGARSLAPREGGDPDAILSRAEAALDRADIPAALAEIGTLPPEGQAPFADWIAAAERRQAALAATDALLEQMN